MEGVEEEDDSKSVSDCFTQRDHQRSKYHSKAGYEATSCDDLPGTLTKFLQTSDPAPDRHSRPSAWEPEGMPVNDEGAL